MGKLYNNYTNEIKKLKNLSYKGIKLDSFLAVPILYRVPKNSIYTRLKSFIGKIFFKNKIEIICNTQNSPNLLFKRNSFNRKDHKKIEDSFIYAAKSKFNIIELKIKNKVLDTNFIINIIDLCKIYFLIKKSNLIEPLENSLILLSCSKNHKFYEKLLKKYNIKKVVVFCDVNSDDNYLCQVANNINIDTYTLQHGMFNYECRQFDDVNFVHCEASVSKGVFTWGQYTKDEFLKCGKSKEFIFPIGNPKLNHLKQYDMDSFKDRDKFLLLFDHNMYIKSNLKLINLAEEIFAKNGLKYHVKMHPINNASDYPISKDKYKNNINYDQIIKNYKFAICHNTAMYYELLYLGMPVFRLKDESFSDIDNIDFNKITCADDIINNLKHIYKNPYEYSKNISQVSDYYIYRGDSKKAILNGLMKDET